MSAASKMRGIAEIANAAIPPEMNQLYDNMVEGIHQCAKKGLLGMGMVIDLPDHLLDYLPHIIADLRGGCFEVDVVEVEPSMQGIRARLYITW